MTTGLQFGLEAMADKMMLVDGDRDHMNTSRLTCQDVQAAAMLMREAARILKAARSVCDEVQVTRSYIPNKIAALIDAPL